MVVMRMVMSMVPVPVLVQAQDVAVVGCSARGVGEDGVGLGQEGEVVRGVWVGAVRVGVVRFGEGVEGSLNGVSLRCFFFFCL